MFNISPLAIAICFKEAIAQSAPVPQGILASDAPSATIGRFPTFLDVVTEVEEHDAVSSAF